MRFLEGVLTDLIGGLIAAGILSAFVYLSRKVGPQQVRRWAEKLRQLGWPLLAAVFFATSLLSALLRGAPMLGALALAFLLLVLAFASFILIRYGPARFRRLESGVRAYGWQFLTGVFFLSTVALFFINIERKFPGERIVFVVDLADEEMIVLRDLLDELEPRLGHKVLLMNVDSDRQITRLDKMAALGAMKWDLIAVDNSMLGILMGKRLVEELSPYRGYDDLIPRSLLPSLRAIADLNVTVQNQPLKDVLVDWFKAQNVGGKPIPEYLARVMATLVRLPETQRGGNRKWTQVYRPGPKG